MHGGELSIVSKDATAGGVTTTRLYIRPGELPDGTQLNKGSSLKHYLHQNGEREVPTYLMGADIVAEALRRILPVRIGLSFFP